MIQLLQERTEISRNRIERNGFQTKKRKSYYDVHRTFKKFSQFVSRSNVGKILLIIIPAKETPNMGSKHFDCPITLLHFKLRKKFPESSREK